MEPGGTERGGATPQEEIKRLKSAVFTCHAEENGSRSSREHTLFTCGVMGGWERRDSLTCRCNKDGFHGDGRGWHGDGVIDPQIKHDNEPRLPPLYSHQLKFPARKDGNSKTYKRLEDEFPLFLFFCFSLPPFVRLSFSEVVRG